MRRFPWFAFTVPVILLLVASFTQAAPLPQLVGDYVQLVPIVAQVPPPTAVPPPIQELVLLPSDAYVLRNHTIFTEGVITNETEANSTNDPAAALAAFSAQGRITAYYRVLSGGVGSEPRLARTQVTRYQTEAGALLGQDWFIAISAPSSFCTAWQERVVLGNYGRMRVIERLCSTSGSGMQYGQSYAVVLRGIHVVSIDLFCFPVCSETTVADIADQAAVKVPLPSFVYPTPTPSPTATPSHTPMITLTPSRTTSPTPSGHHASADSVASGQRGDR